MAAAEPPRRVVSQRQTAAPYQPTGWRPNGPSFNPTSTFQRQELGKNRRKTLETHITKYTYVSIAPAEPSPSYGPPPAVSYGPPESPTTTEEPTTTEGAIEATTGSDLQVYKT